ncbi:MAG TPA: PDGLE domain-containing protein [Candidatus Omnitrophota bacterium]|nr:PDGLE domain-containing protein [Candidatus Omnitrophota bacterium]HNQ50864.1 PDGLE domain-containing protein [Candidatus Omnitrophota bacterium]HQO37945.1 PDGLE domain-containing protein [Candidatus Omnitrophota bacterium]HQQ05448.1 PDGLE domain-containing protein [Candidatus Omnitrophota bacterium]
MNKKEILFGLLAALFLAMALSPFASSFPDGLERVAEDKGFLEKGEAEPVVASPVPDYSWPGVKSEKLATSAAGVAGTLLVFGAACGFGALLKKKGTA